MTWIYYMVQWYLHFPATLPNRTDLVIDSFVYVNKRSPSPLLRPRIIWSTPDITQHLLLGILDANIWCQCPLVSSKGKQKTKIAYSPAGIRWPTSITLRGWKNQTEVIVRSQTSKPPFIIPRHESDETAKKGSSSPMPPILIHYSCVPTVYKTII